MIVKHPGERTAIRIHLLVALLSPLLLALGLVGMALTAIVPLGPLVALVALLPFVLAPLVGYRLALYDPVPIPALEPCARTGNTPMGYWFEFDSLPGRRLFTSDRRLAEEVRARAPSPLIGDSFEITLRPPHDTRPRQHVAFAARSLLFAVAGTALGSVWNASLIAAYVVFSEAGDLEAWTTALRTLPLFSGLLFAWSSVPLAAFGVAFVAVFVAIFAVWNVLLRSRPVPIRVTRSALRTGSRTFDLDDDTRKVRLEHTAFDARLTLTGRGAPLVLHGPHGQLHPLSQWLAGRPSTPGPEREQVERRIAALTQRTG